MPYKLFYVYILLCADDSFYTGHTDDLPYRYHQHQAGDVPGYTQSRRPVQLVWSDGFETREEAILAERLIKKWTRAKKQALIRGDFDLLKDLARKKNWKAYESRHG